MKSDVFNNELDFIVRPDVREFARTVLEDAPDYFFKSAASSNARFHPAYELGDGGLVRHTKAVFKFFYYIAHLRQYDISERLIDLGYVACLTHDIFRFGDDNAYDKKIKSREEISDVFEHPFLAAEFIRGYKGKNYLCDDEIEIIAMTIASHMSEWNICKDGIELPEPKALLEKILHMSDFLTSRKDICISFDDDEYAYHNSKN